MRIDDLKPYWQQRFEDAYRAAAEEFALRRARCSRDDFAAGFIAALLQLKVPIEAEAAKDRAVV